MTMLDQILAFDLMIRRLHGRGGLDNFFHERINPRYWAACPMGPYSVITAATKPDEELSHLPP